MKLNKLQLEEIKAFISRKGIEYLDVQMEILDHMAIGVEERMTTNPGLSFDEAVKQTHASFGIFGFGGVEDSIINMMSKKYNRIFWKTYTSFFNYKYIGLVLLAIFSLYQAQVFIADYFRFLAYFLSLVLLIIVSSHIVWFKNKSYKKLLLYRNTFSYFSFVGSGFLIFNYLINSIRYFEIISPQQILIVSSLMLVLFLLYVVSAIKVALLGLKESKLLIEKYQILEI